MKYDKNLPEVLGEVRLSETGEMIGQVVAGRDGRVSTSRPVIGQFDQNGALIG